MKDKKNIEDYKPTGLVFGKNAYSLDIVNGFPILVRNTFEYERNWFCNENKIIHHSEKEVLNCKYCSKKYN